MNTRTMRQPRKDVLRDQLVLAADEIIRLKGVIDTLKVLHGWTKEAFKREYRTPWYRRWFRRFWK